MAKVAKPGTMPGPALAMPTPKHGEHYTIPGMPGGSGGVSRIGSAAALSPGMTAGPRPTPFTAMQANAAPAMQPQYARPPPMKAPAMPVPYQPQQALGSARAGTGPSSQYPAPVQPFPMAYRLDQPPAPALGPKSEEKMAFFDFDNTLTQEMVFHDLQRLYGISSAPTLAMAHAQSDEWWIGEFGGRERLRKLENFLMRLRSMGVKCYVCSMNVPEIITEGFRRVGILHHFMNERGVVRIVPAWAGGDKGKRVKMILDKHSAEPVHALFADDLQKNCTNVAGQNHDIASVNCSSKGLQDSDFEQIISNFAMQTPPKYAVNSYKDHQSMVVMSGYESAEAAMAPRLSDEPVEMPRLKTAAEKRNSRKKSIQDDGKRKGRLCC